MWSPTLQTLIGNLFQHVDDAENIVVSIVFELLEPNPSNLLRVAKRFEGLGSDDSNIVEKHDFSASSTC